jgi:hypothetical protein
MFKKDDPAYHVERVTIDPVILMSCRALARRWHVRLLHYTDPDRIIHEQLEKINHINAQQHPALLEDPLGNIPGLFQYCTSFFTECEFSPLTFSTDACQSHKIACVLTGKLSRQVCSEYGGWEIEK